MLEDRQARKASRVVRGARCGPGRAATRRSASSRGLGAGGRSRAARASGLATRGGGAAARTARSGCHVDGTDCEAATSQAALLVLGRVAGVVEARGVRRGREDSGRDLRVEEVAPDGVGQPRNASLAALLLDELVRLD